MCSDINSDKPADADSAPAKPDARAFQLFSASLDQPPAQRESWLQAQCAGDADLWLQIERLLQAEKDSTGFLESAPVWQPVRDHCGEQIGAYELIRVLAQGGMGTVYLGRRNDGSFEQQVAVKLFNPRSLSGASQAHFDTERNILAALEHPGIARIIDGGETEDGIPYVVMELVQGQTISRYCVQHKLDLPGRLGLILKLCEALDYAHRCGIVHRDIKADNVLVTEQGEPKLIDFGIAKILQPDDVATGHAEPALTGSLTGRLMTPEYASPEQLRGEATMPGSDIYSLGVLMYELLTGSRPHHVAGMSPAAMERVVCRTVPLDPSKTVAGSKSAPPPGLADASTLQRQLRGDLDRIVMTALRLEPELRYASAAALASDIRRYFAGQPVVARGASRWYRTAKFVHRHQPVVIATGLAFVLLLAALLQLAVQVEEARTQRDIAVDQARQAALAKDFLIGMIGRADPYENADAPTLAGALRQSIAELDEQFAGQPELEADMRYAIGYALQNLGEIPLARVQLERALVLRVATQDPLKLAEVYDGLGIVCWWESDFACSDRHFADALELLETGHATSIESIAMRVDVLSSRAGMQIDQGRYDLSRDYAERALSLAQQHSYDDKETLAATWLNLATALEGLEQNEAALDAFQKALTMQEDLTGTMHPSYAIILNNMALYYFKLGQHENAVQALTEALGIRRQTLGEEHPQTATSLFNLARVLIDTGQHAAALEYALEAVRVAELGYPDNHPRIGKAHEALALVYQALQQFDLARQHAQQAAAIYAAAHDVDPDWLRSANELLQQLSSIE